jgi:AcrR family transcriptional regulator
MSGDYYILGDYSIIAHRPPFRTPRRATPHDNVAREHGHARRARQTADRILQAAVEVFTEDGYRAATIEGIAARADVAASSVYNHFSSKPGVAQALSERALGVHWEYVAKAWAVEGSPIERLIAAAGATLAFAKEQTGLFQAISLSYLGPLGLFPPNTPAAEAITDRRREQFDRICAALSDAVNAGELRPLDIPATAQYLIATWAGVLTMHGGPGAPVDPANALAAGLRAVFEGMGTTAMLTADRRLPDHYQAALVRHGLVPPPQR